MLFRSLECRRSQNDDKVTSFLYCIFFFALFRVLGSFLSFFMLSVTPSCFLSNSQSYFSFYFLDLLKNPFNDSAIIIKFLLLDVAFLSTRDKRPGFALFLRNSQLSQGDRDLNKL